MTVDAEGRLLVLDTETTGISWENGHRIIEIGIVEIINRRFTGNNFHQYVDPEREIEEEAQAVHGLSLEELKVLSEGRVFGDIYEQLMSYINGSPLVIHNAGFDMGHLDAECRRLGKPQLSGTIMVIDTLVKANNMYPGQRNNLDALARRLKVDVSDRSLHGALLDAEILADVFLSMTTHQHRLVLAADNVESGSAGFKTKASPTLQYAQVDASIAGSLQVIPADDLELRRHAQFMQHLAEKSGDEDLVF